MPPPGTTPPPAGVAETAENDDDDETDTADVLAGDETPDGATAGDGAASEGGNTR